MNKLTFIHILLPFFMLISSCTSQEVTKDDLLQTIQEQEATLKAANSDAMKNEEAAKTLVKNSILFADRFPDDKMAPAVLFKAADVSRGLGDFEQAIDLWGEVIEVYPEYEKTPEALFHQGFIMDKDVGDKNSAIAYYEAFLSTYPTHPLAKDVALLKQLLQMDKSPEELVKEFEQKRTNEE